MKGRKNGYIWHTTGSGKTLTSFKASQVIVENPKVAKVVFVVDRADLDYQTTKEFNFFSPGSVDGKRDLIEEFVASYLPALQSEDETKDAFWSFWTKKRAEAFEKICVEEDLDADAFSALISAYQFSDKEPLTDEVMAAIRTPPGIVKRKRTARRIVSKMIDHIETFDEQMGNLEAA